MDWDVYFDDFDELVKAHPELQSVRALVGTWSDLPQLEAIAILLALKSVYKG